MDSFFYVLAVCFALVLLFGLLVGLCIKDISELQQKLAALDTQTVFHDERLTALLS